MHPGGDNYRRREHDLTDTPSAIYRIDGEDALTGFDHRFADFARENGDPELPQRALGHTLWEFISGSETQALWRALLHRARGQEDSISVPFRCDAPSARRRMRIEILPLAGSAIEFRTTLLDEVPRSAQPLPAGAEFGGGDLVVVCSWCNRVREGPTWMEIEEAVTRHNWFATTESVGVTHGICADCARLTHDFA